ncbi:MAG: hypothetical protein JST16_08930 [Bdellovibrionales bacterium]|nr:hypothetical protein [Bdellovibrionales bacterium]
MFQLAHRAFLKSDIAKHRALRLRLVELAASAPTDAEIAILSARCAVDALTLVDDARIAGKWTNDLSQQSYLRDEQENARLTLLQYAALFRDDSRFEVENRRGLAKTLAPLFSANPQTSRSEALSTETRLFHWLKQETARAAANAESKTDVDIGNIKRPKGGVTKGPPPSNAIIKSTLEEWGVSARDLSALSESIVSSIKSDDGVQLPAVGELPLYAERTKYAHLRNLNAINFLKAVWGRYIDDHQLYQFNLKKLDPALLTAVRNACKYAGIDTGTVLPKKRDFVDRQLAEASEDRIRSAAALTQARRRRNNPGTPR